MERAAESRGTRGASAGELCHTGEVTSRPNGGGGDTDTRSEADGTSGATPSTSACAATSGSAEAAVTAATAATAATVAAPATLGV